MVLRLRARWILPISAPVIEDGELVVEGERIADVRPRRVDGHSVGDHMDLGEAVLLPGLVNAHCHLEYTFLRHSLADLPMFEWLSELIELKKVLEPDDWHASAMLGAEEAVLSGTTTVADCTDSGASVRALAATGLRGIAYREVFGIDDNTSIPATLSELDGRVGAMQGEAAGTLVRVGVSPHSPYTVSPTLMRAVADYARERELPVCIHAAESQPEAELVRCGTGVRADQLAARGIQWKTPRSGVLEYLKRLGVLSKDTLLAHTVQLSSSEADVLAQSGASVAHCPRSNARLGNGIAPLSSLVRCTGGSDGDFVPHLGFGTDSVVSCGSADMFEEMRFGLLLQRAARHRASSPTAQQVLALATLGGAKALNMDGCIGTLEAGKLADVIAVRLDGLHIVPCHDPVTALVHSARGQDCVLTMVQGRIIARDQRLLSCDTARAQERMRAFAERLRALRTRC